MERERMATLSQRGLMIDSGTLAPPENTADNFLREHPELGNDGGRGDHLVLSPEREQHYHQLKDGYETAIFAQ